MSTPPPLRSAEIIAVGSELLGSTRVDTNSLFLADQLAALGIELRIKVVVGDDRADIAAVLRQAIARADLVVLTGGLGPTDDDLTRDVVAGVLGLPLTQDDRILTSIRERFSHRGLAMPEVNRRQAQVPAGAAVLENLNGTAPGLLIEHDGGIIVLLPGPPRELQPMVQALCAGRLAERAGAERLYRASLFVTGRSESYIEEISQPIYSRWRDRTPPIATTILASPGQIELHLMMREIDAARARAILEEARDELVRALGDDVFATDGHTLEEVVGAQLRDRGLTIAAAESCTGGLLTSRLTDVAGSSAYVRGSVVAYDNEMKTSLLGVAAPLIEAHGAVSEPVAMAMAEGIRERTHADVAVGITGIAGPAGGTPAKPVGTVVVAVIVPGQPAYVRTFSFIGNRTMVKFQAAQAALDRVRRLLARG